MGVIVTIASQKGGVGKTTTAVNLAYSLSVGGQKVLLFDLDPQGNGSSGVGFGSPAKERKGCLTVSLERRSLKSALTETAFDNLALVPACADLFQPVASDQFATYACVATCRCVPRPSIPSSISSPAFRKMGGLNPPLTPEGVPVEITSPGSKLINWLR